MRDTIRVALVVSAAVAFGAAPVAARGFAPHNTLEVVVASGPHAGTYKPPASEVICMHAKQQKMYTVAYKDFAPKGAKSLSEAGINVTNPDAATAGKHGDVRIAFGDPSKNPTVYDVDGAPVTMRLIDKGAEIVFDGKSKQGASLRITAQCVDVEQM